MSFNVPWSKADVDRAVHRISREAPAARIQIRCNGFGLAAIRGGSPKDGAAIIFDPVACIQADLDEAIAWLKGAKIKMTRMNDAPEAKQ